MKNNLIAEIFVVAALVALLLVLLNPFGWWMPTATAMMLTAALCVA